MKDQIKILKIIIYYLMGDKKWVDRKELFNFIKNPPTSKVNKEKALSYIINVKENGDHYIITFRSFKLYYPKQISLDMLYMVIYQIFYPDHWHYYEIDQTRVRKDDIVIDCGAAEGLFTALAAERCKKVYAIEPMRLWHKGLKETFKQFDNIELLPFALSDKPGYMYISEDSISSTINNTTGSKIEVKTLDEVFSQNSIPITYIKADLEGSDLDMLKGAVNTIERYLPKIAITTYHDKNHAYEISKVIKKINPKYKIEFRGISLKNCPVMLHAWI